MELGDYLALSSRVLQEVIRARDAGMWMTDDDPVVVQPRPKSSGGPPPPPPPPPHVDVPSYPCNFVGCGFVGDTPKALKQHEKSHTPKRA